jgi:hypothetical protein
MTLAELKAALDRLERLLEMRDILLAVIAEGSRDWELSSFVTVNGVKKPFSIPVGNAVVSNLLNNRLASINAEIASLKTTLGIDP